MVTYKVAVLPGDGIGPEVIEEGKRVLDAVSEIDGFDIDWVTYDWDAERYLKTGALIGENELKELSPYRAIYFGAVGDPRVPPGVLEQGIVLAIRFYFDQFVNLRPVKLYSGVPTPLKNKSPSDINFVCIRENTEDLYSGLGAIVRGSKSTDRLLMIRNKYSLNLDVTTEMLREKEFAYQIGVISRMGTERVIKYAFDYARKHGMNKVSTADKANVMPQIYGFWRECFERVSKSYPDIQSEMLFADATSMWFVKNPEKFKVAVFPNLFGDVLTDLGAAIQGGLGLAPGGNINPDGTSMFEPIHGSAPSYKGKNISNPIATILAGALLLDHLDLVESSHKVEAAVENVLREGKIRTYDMGGSSKTSEMGEAIAKKIQP